METASIGAAAGEKRSKYLSPRYLLDYGIVAAVIGLIIVLSFAAPNFLTVNNFKNILDQNAYLALASFGMTLVIISGGFDLSTGPLFAFVGVVTAWVAANNDPVTGMIAGALIGLLVGVVNGTLITSLKVHSFLITLAIGIILGGFSLTITEGRLIQVPDDSFTNLGRGSLIAGIPNSIVLMVLVGIVLSIILRRTVLGRYIFAVGGSPIAARFSGVPINRVVITTFAISGFTAALGGLIEVSRSGSGQADPGNASGLALDAIAAVVIGGTSIMGGRGAIWRTALGVLLLALIQNGFNLLGVAPQWRSIVSGAVIVIAVGLNSLSGRK